MRRGRAEKLEVGAHRVTVRDEVLLALVAEAQPVTARQLRGFTAISVHMLYRRLRVLEGMGLTARVTPGLNLPDRWTLTLSGRVHIAEKLGRPIEEMPLVTVREGSSFRHHDMTVDIASALTIAAARNTQWQLVDFVFERAVRRMLGAPRGALVPDAVGCFARTDGVAHALAIEADAGTCDPKWVAVNKLLPYAEHWSARRPLCGAPRFSVCIVTPDLRRAHGLARAAWACGVPASGMVYFLPHGALDARTILGPVWFTPRALGADEGFRLATEAPLPGVNTEGQRRVDGQGAWEARAGACVSSKAPGRSDAWRRR